MIVRMPQRPSPTTNTGLLGVCGSWGGWALILVDGVVDCWIIGSPWRVACCVLLFVGFWGAPDEDELPWGLVVEVDPLLFRRNFSRWTSRKSRKYPSGIDSQTMFYLYFSKHHPPKHHIEQRPKHKYLLWSSLFSTKPAKDSMHQGRTRSLKSGGASTKYLFLKDIFWGES